MTRACLSSAARPWPNDRRVQGRNIHARQARSDLVRGSDLKSGVSPQLNRSAVLTANDINKIILPVHIVGVVAAMTDSDPSVESERASYDILG